MHSDISRHLSELSALCRCCGDACLEVFGSAVRGVDFGASHSDADFLVTFTPAASNDLAVFMDFMDAMEAFFGPAVDLVEREAIEASRNFVRRCRILAGAQTVFG